MLFRSKIYIVKSGEFQESCKIPLNDMNYEDDCVSLLSDEKEQLNEFRSKLIVKKVMYSSPYMRVIDVILHLYLDTFEFNK